MQFHPSHQVSHVSQRTIAWGFVGCGSVTERKSGPAFSQVPGSRVVAVMRRDAAKAQDYARRHGISRWYDDADRLINDPEVNAVYVATPPSTHMLYALKAIAAGKPVYIEKPMAMDHRQCARILAASEEAGVPVFVAYYRRALPRFVQVQQLLSAGTLGALRTVRTALYRTHHPESQSPSFWRTQPGIAGGGLFMDLGSHTLDLLDFLLGPLTLQGSTAGNLGGWYEAEDTVSLCFQAANGVQGVGQWGFSSFRALDEVEITGDAGVMTFSTFGDGPVVVTTAEGTRVLEFLNPQAIQQPLITQVVAELQGVGRSPSTGYSAARTSALMDGVLADYRSGR